MVAHQHRPLFNISDQSIDIVETLRSIDPLIDAHNDTRCWNRHCVCCCSALAKLVVVRSSGGARGWRTSAAAWQIIMRTSASQNDEVISVSSEDHDEDQKSPAKKFIKEKCTICYETLGFEHVELDGCDHVFHPKCLTQYFRKMNTAACPLCRRLDPTAFGEGGDDDSNVVWRTGVSEQEIQRLVTPTQ